MSSAVETGRSPFPTFFTKATESLICFPIRATHLILVFMLIAHISGETM
ncbi:hypothetical protein LINPERPRIM_LOCUS24710 [Linum perenne]